MRILFLILLTSFITVTVFAQSDNRIMFNDQELWLNGGNIAWVNFGRDVGPGTSPLDDFEEMFSQVRENGGNTMRLWVHITGESTPSWDGNYITGPGEGTITDLENLLDMAWEYNVSMILCLWSFDMLRITNGNTVTDRAKALLQDSTLTQAYIDNSLIPMVDALADHPAILAWEIFNEPEGMSNEFGWDFNHHIPMADIQRFVNQTAGAIHRANSDALVSNGAWGFDALANTSNPKSKNYYSDTELISAGKDSLGYLDFYMVHFYEYQGTALSPFHNDKSTWGLDKPVVVGEFGIPSNDLFGLPKDNMYEELYRRGYAGSLVWQWVDWYQDRGDFGPSWLRGLDQMLYMQQNYPGDINIINTKPSIRTFNTLFSEIEAGGQSELSWEVFNSDSVRLNDEQVQSNGTKIVSPIETTEYQLIAVGIEGDADTAYVTIEVLPAGSIDRAINRPSRSSTFESCCGENRTSNRAFDGDLDTRWSSAWNDGSGESEADPNIDEDPNSEWIDVDLGTTYEVGAVQLNWEAHPSEYDIQTSFDGINWNTVFSETNSTGGKDSIAFESKELARFVRMQGNDRATEFGYSLWDFKVTGTVSLKQPPKILITEPSNEQDIAFGSDLKISAEIEMGSSEIEYVAFYVNGDSIGSDSTFPYSFTFRDVPEGMHEIYVIAKDAEGFHVQSESVLVEGRTDIYTIRLEAEEAVLTGATSVKPGVVGASRGAAVSMEGSGSISWNNLDLPEGEVYELTVRHYLPYDYKEQKLLINGAIIDTLIFDEPYLEWKDLVVILNAELPIESVGINHYWGYMDFDYVELTVLGVTVSNEREEEALDKAKRYSLQQNYPNPFNPTTTIRFSLPEASNIQLKVYNSIGQEVATLVDEFKSSGDHSIKWDAASFSSGVYFYQLFVSDQVLTKKMVLIK